MVNADSIDFANKKKIQEEMVHSSGLRGYVDVMQQLKIDPIPLLAKHGITLEDLQNDNSWIKLISLIQLLEESSQLANCPDLGLRISIYQDISILGVLGMIIQSAMTFREMIKYGSDLMFLHGTATRLYVNEYVTTELFDQSTDIFEIILDIQLNDSKNIVSKRQAIDMSLAVCHRVLAYLSGNQYQLLKVSLPHSPLAPLHVYKRCFNAEVVMGQKHAALYLHKDMLNIKLNRVDSGLRKIVDSYLEQGFHNHHDSIVDRVRHAIRIHLSSPKANKVEIAQMLAMHPRSLQRKLNEAGTSFEEIKEQLKRQLLLQYLVDSQLSMSHIASMLGFSEQSVLSRACKNWFGMSPRQLKMSASHSSHSLLSTAQSNE